MPKNKRESLIFTVIMCFLMVYGMSVFNVWKARGAFSFDVIVSAWMGLPPAYLVAALLDWFVVGPIAKGIAFGHLVQPGKSSQRSCILAVNACMVLCMVPLMSLYGAFEAVLSTGMGFSAVPLIWLGNIPFNYVCAICWNMLVAGPLARRLFRRAFPEGTVLAQPVPADALA